MRWLPAGDDTVPSEGRGPFGLRLFLLRLQIGSKLYRCLLCRLWREQHGLVLASVSGRLFRSGAGRNRRRAGSGGHGAAGAWPLQGGHGPATGPRADALLRHAPSRGQRLGALILADSAPTHVCHTATFRLADMGHREPRARGRLGQIRPSRQGIRPIIRHTQDRVAVHPGARLLAALLPSVLGVGRIHLRAPVVVTPVPSPRPAVLGDVLAHGRNHLRHALRPPMEGHLFRAEVRDTLLLPGAAKGVQPISGVDRVDTLIRDPVDEKTSTLLVVRERALRPVEILAGDILPSQFANGEVGILLRPHGDPRDESVRGGLPVKEMGHVLWGPVGESARRRVPAARRNLGGLGPIAFAEPRRARP